MGQEFGRFDDEIERGASTYSEDEEPALDLELSEAQSTIYYSEARFRGVVAGRRFGKTYLSIPELMRGADGPDKIAWYAAPTYKQAKEIMWSPLKKYLGPWIERKNETELSLLMAWGGIIALKGAEDPDALRGKGLDFLVCDEYADIDPRAWNTVMRPMLADRMGRALFIGTPKGYNHFHKIIVEAKGLPDWASFSFTTLQGGNVPASELEDAKRYMDIKTYRQEFEASFEAIVAGRVYYAFGRNVHLGRSNLIHGFRFVGRWTSTSTR